MLFYAEKGGTSNTKPVEEEARSTPFLKRGGRAPPPFGRRGGSVGIPANWIEGGGGRALFPPKNRERSIEGDGKLQLLCRGGKGQETLCMNEVARRSRGKEKTSYALLLTFAGRENRRRCLDAREGEKKNCLNA